MTTKLKGQSQKSRDAINLKMATRVYSNNLIYSAINPPPHEFKYYNINKSREMSFFL